MTHTNFPERARVSLRDPAASRRLGGLVSRLLPAVVLAGGLIWMIPAMQQATAQTSGAGSNFGGTFGAAATPAGAGVATQGQRTFNGGQFAAPSEGNTGAYPTGQPAYRTAMQPGQAGPAGQNTATSSIPAVPAGGTDPVGDGGGGDEDTESSSWFQPPAFVSKVMSGGWLMLPLGVCSLVVLTLSLERLVALRRGRVIPRPFVRRFTECVEDGVLSYDEATELCKEFDCPVSEVFRAALRRWGRPMIEIEQAVMDAGDRVSDGLKKYLRVFHAISNVAPLIGLLGTVIGMIQAFEVISDQQSIGRPETLASGISMALMTTAGGLSVAIPAYLAYMYFSSKSDRYLGEIEKLCGRVIDCISAEGLESSDSSRGKKRKAA